MSMIVNKSESKGQEFSKEVLQVAKIQVLRKQNDELRKELGRSIDEKFKLLISIKEQQSIIFGDEKSIGKFLSPEFIQSMISRFEYFNKLYQYSKNIEGIQQQQKINEIINKQREELQSMNRIIQSKEQTIQKLNQTIDQKIIQYEQVQIQFFNAFQEYYHLQKKLASKKVSERSLKEIVANELNENWEQETTEKILLIEERTALRKQLSLLHKANNLLDQKFIKLNNQFENSLERNLKIGDLKTKNQNLANQLREEKNRKNILEEAKEAHVHNKYVRQATDIAQKWDGEKRECQNLLLRIIEKVNVKLPFKKLDDVRQIIKAAEIFSQAEMQSERQNTSIRRMEQENNQQHQI